MPALSIAIASPRRPAQNSGNDVTAERWAERLCALGHRVVVAPVTTTPDEPLATSAAAALAEVDGLVALHARRCSAAVRWWRTNRRDRPLIVALAGTDLYLDMPDDPLAMASVEAADRLIVLQEAAIERLAGIDPALAAKASVIHQSVARPLPVANPTGEEFRVVVLAHLREVKDPLLAARATRHLPPSSRIMVHLAGAAHDDRWERQALKEEADNRRFRWHRGLPRSEALSLLASGHVLACTSLLEGGANAVSEAIAIGVPVVGTEIDGNRGMLGDDYPGLVPVGDHEALAALLMTLDSKGDALDDLRRRTAALQPRTRPDVERGAWSALLAELFPGS